MRRDASDQAPPIDTLDEAKANLHPFLSPNHIGRWAIRLLLFTIALSWIGVGIDLSNLRQLYDATQGTTVPRDLRSAQEQSELWLVAAQTVLFLLTGATFMFWLYQARANLRALGVRRPTYDRSWCITGFLVPVLNLFRPYQVIQEIWRASDPRNLDPFEWREQPVPALLTIWWATFLGSFGLRGLAWLVDFNAGPSLAQLQLAVGLMAAADVLAGLAAGLACFVITRLSSTQEAKWALQRDAPAA